ncbi:MAG: SEC-C metal-binding domain-containing protein [Clostridia bacterium]|nr:SEC-C metal-binding domain-containing protein [Clostridia bacterium]
MKKIGRNDPCPCGSGKKYKKCCLNKPRPILSYFQKFLMYKEVDDMSTEDIIQRLDSIGIRFDKDVFLRDIEEYYSAQQLSENWLGAFSVAAKGREEDFPWLAAWVLWGRLAPAENVPKERIAHLVDEGYQYLSTEDHTRACDMWLEAWEAIKYRCKSESNDLDFFNRHYRDDFFVSNLCQDLEGELHNAGLEDSVYFQKRIDYCNEFLRLFPGASDLIIHNMRRAVAESYASLGDYERCDSEFERLVQDYPTNPWGCIGWGDMYFLRKEDDYGKAKELYLKALAVAKERFDIDAVHERLDDIEHPTRPQPPEMPS